MIALPVATLIAAYLLYWHANDRSFGVVNLLILTYIVMGLAALTLENLPIFRGRWPVPLEPMLFLSASFAIAFWGFAGFRERRFTTLRIDHLGLYRALETTLMVGGIGAMLFFLPFARESLQGDILINR